MHRANFHALPTRLEKKFIDVKMLARKKREFSTGMCHSLVAKSDAIKNAECTRGLRGCSQIAPRAINIRRANVNATVNGGGVLPRKFRPEVDRAFNRARLISRRMCLAVKGTQPSPEGKTHPVARGWPRAKNRRFSRTGRHPRVH